MSHGLSPRPLPPEEDLAAVVAAAELFVRERRRALDRTPTWRFSGRWFNAGRYALRRPHELN